MTKNKRAASVLEDVQYTNIFLFGTVPVIAWHDKVDDNQDIVTVDITNENVFYLSDGGKFCRLRAFGIGRLQERGY